MAWTVTITDKTQTTDGLSVSVNFNNGAGMTFDKTYTTTDVSDANWLKNQAKATLANIKARATFANTFNVNDTITGIGN